VLDFVENVPKHTHFVIFYEDSKKAIELKERFITSGVRKQETAILVSDNPDDARVQLRREGVDVDRYEKEGQLLLRKLQNPFADPMGFEHGFKESYKAIFSGVNGSCRLLGASIELGETSGLERMVLELEKMTQDTIDGNSPHSIYLDREISAMCHYKVDLSGKNPVHMNWVRNNAKNHHRVILIRKDGSAELYDPSKGEIPFQGTRPSKSRPTTTEDKLEEPVSSGNENDVGMKALEKRIKTLSKEELDREIAELSNDLNFLESQVQADFESYSSDALIASSRKIADIKRKLELHKIELARRD
jgi:MEDS: MEthanogen/methylotroph, DcmR Sensory domain